MVIATEGLNRNHVLFRNERQGREDMALEERRGKLMIREMKDYDKSRKKQREIEARFEAARQGLYTGSPLSDATRSPLLSSRTGSPGRRSGSKGPSYASLSPRLMSETEDLRARMKAKNVAPPPMLDSPSPTSPVRGHSLANSVKSTSAAERKVTELQALLDQERARNHALDFEREKVLQRSHNDAAAEVEELRNKLQNSVYQTTILENSQREVNRLENRVTDLTQQLNSKTLESRSMQVQIESRNEDLIKMNSLQAETDSLRRKLRTVESELEAAKSTPRSRGVTPTSAPASPPPPVPPLLQLYNEASLSTRDIAMDVLKSGRRPSFDEEVNALRKQVTELSKELSDYSEGSFLSKFLSITGDTVIGFLLLLLTLVLSLGLIEIMTGTPIVSSFKEFFMGLVDMFHHSWTSRYLTTNVEISVIVLLCMALLGYPVGWVLQDCGLGLILIFTSVALAMVSLDAMTDGTILPELQKWSIDTQQYLTEDASMYVDYRKEVIRTCLLRLSECFQ